MTTQITQVPNHLQQNHKDRTFEMTSTSNKLWNIEKQI